MIIKVQTYAYIDVKDHDQAEDACRTLGSLDRVLTNQVRFPEGDVVDVDVDHYEIATAEEIAERGLEEV